MIATSYLPFFCKSIVNVSFVSLIGNFCYASCDELLSTLKPNKQVFNLSKYRFAFAKAIISVVHTGVKSPWV